MQQTSTISTLYARVFFGGGVPGRGEFVSGRGGGRISQLFVVCRLC